MRRTFKQAALLAFGVLLLSLSMPPAATSRNWSKNPVNLAQDYTTIVDNRGKGDIVLVMWLAPSDVANETAKELLDKYIVLGVVHAHFAQDGTATFDKIDRLEARDGEGHPLTALNTATMPPAVVGTLVTVQTGLGRALGRLGQGTKWFVFASGDVHACGHGRLSVPFANETYTYDTPTPGCPRA